MKITWILLLFLLGCGVKYVTCTGECDTAHVEQCLQNVVHFERQGFLQYGKDGEELNETCEMLSESRDCIKGYWQQCNENTKACDEECLKLQVHIKVLSQNKGLINAADGLCNSGATRDAYLENYPCFERNAESYAVCHNRSRMSQDCGGTTDMNELSQATVDQCCFITWYHDCFTNITSETCNENATDLVSSLLQTLLAQASEKMCNELNGDVSNTHTTPPEEDDRNEDVHDEEITEDDSSDDEHKKIADLDKTKEGSFKSQASFPPTWPLCIALMYISLSMYSM